jgi:hypothetical protein
MAARTLDMLLRWVPMEIHRVQVIAGTVLAFPHYPLA